MGFIKQLLSEASSLFFLGVGISGMRRVESDISLNDIPAGETWRLDGLRARLAEHRGEPAVLLECEGESGLARVENMQFAEGEICIDWAARSGAFGIAIDVRGEDSLKLIRFASDDGRSWNVSFLSFDRSGPEAVARTVDELSGVSLDWVRVRIIIQKDRIAVIVNDHHIPCLRVSDYRPEPPGGSIGLLLERGASCYFTNLKCVEIRKQVKI